MVQQKQFKEKDLLIFKKYLISKCIKDPTYKKQFLADPKKAIETEFKVQLPNEVKVTAYEETDTAFCVVLPSKSAIAAGHAGEEFELSDEELKVIAGGKGPILEVIDSILYHATIGKDATGGKQGVSG